MTKLDDDLAVCNVENMQVKDDERRNVQICTKCDVDSDLIAKNATKISTKREEPSKGTVQTTERQKTKDAARTIESITGEQTKDP